MILVAVSILNYNGYERTVACVQSLLDAERIADGQYQLQIQLADNASRSDDFLQLQKLYDENPRVHLLKNNENLGFAAGHNQNLKRIIDTFKPDFIWLLNNDAVVDSQTLPAHLLSASQRPEVGLWGATLLEEDGETVQCAGGCLYNSWMSSFRQHGKGTALNKLHEVKPVDYDYIAGASLFFPVATLQRGLQRLPDPSQGPHARPYQWLNEIFFLYFEELDLAQRLKPGLKIGWCKDAQIRHAGGFSTRSGNGSRSEQTEYHSSLSALKFTRLYYPNRLWLMAPGRFLSKCLILVFEGNYNLIKPMVRAYRDFWRA